MTTQPINNEPIKVIHGEYLDVPRGANKLFGKVLLHVPNSNTILKISGQFGTEKWSRIWWLFPPPVDLTGVWRANDGGTYYLRHVGFNVVEWYGRSFNNVFHGEIKCCNPDMRISGEWVDVPRGTVMNSGTLDLRMELTNSKTLQKVSQTGDGFSATTWQKVR